MPTVAVEASPEAPQWRFDAVDLRAGLAFATWRPELGHTQQILDGQTVYYAPPSFAPEPVANVALALGATRGSLQPALLVDGREASFESLEEAGEFIRRAYVSGGGGDGSDGEGGDEPSPAPPQLPDLRDPPNRDGERGEAERVREDESKLVGGSVALAGAVLAFQVRMAELSFGRSGRFESWKVLQAADPVFALRDGATHVVRELLTRRPGPGSPPGASLRWSQDFESWTAMVAKVGLWPVLLGSRSEYRSTIYGWANQQAPWISEELPSELTHAAVIALLLHGDGRMQAFRNSRWWWELTVRHAWAGPSMNIDPLTTLRRLPLPPWSWDHVGNDLQGRASLYHLLCSLTGQPQMAGEARLHDLLLFACACLVAPQSAVPRYWPVTDHDPRSGPDSADMEYVRQVGREAIEWLVEHLPGRAFSKGYENAIGTAKNIRYRPAATAAVP